MKPTEIKSVITKPRTTTTVAPEELAHLLIVDDNTVNRFKLNLYIKSQGYSATMVESGEQAIDSLKMEKFDLILLDLNLPGINGDEVIRRIKANREWYSIPILLISGSDEMDKITRCLELGAEDYLPKPFDPAVLKNRIGGCLEKKQLREQKSQDTSEISVLNQAVLDLEKGEFDPATLNQLVLRRDNLGELALNFLRMAASVQGQTKTKA